MEAVISVEEAATEQEMEEYIYAEKEDIRQGIAGDLCHEKQMYKVPNYFCEYVIGNLIIPTKNKQYIYIWDVLESMKQECDKYDYTIDVLLDYMKGI